MLVRWVLGSTVLPLPVLIDGQKEGEDLLSVTFRSQPG